MSNIPDPMLEAETLLRARNVPFRRATRYQIKIGSKLSYFPHKGTIFVDREPRARSSTGLAALGTVLRELGHLPRAASTSPRHRLSPTPSINVDIMSLDVPADPGASTDQLDRPR